MTYQVVFDIADRVPLIALGTAAAVLALVVIGGGLWDLDVLLPAWPLLVGAAAAFVLLEIAAERSTSSLPFLWPLLLATAIEVARGRLPGIDFERLPRGGAATMFATFTLVFAALSGLGTVGAIGLSQQLAAGRAEILEGPVTDLFTGSKTECFSVQLRRFCYSDFAIQPGFNHMGVVRAADQLRVAAIGDQIVRLEIARPKES